ncbi:MAG: PstS family phosphate ABC transporter substrate-binding protein, partial [Planctomycetota bacterium]
RLFVMLPVLTLLFAAQGCAPRGTGAGSGTADVKINGSSTVFPISDAVAEEFRGKKPEVKVTVKYTGTGGGMEQFARGEIDICDASRGIKESEVQACNDAGIAFTEFTVAYDGIAIVVNPENDWCDSLTIDQLNGMWSTERPLKKWSDINPDWPDQEISLFGPDDKSGTFDYFTKVVNGEEKLCHDQYMPSANDNQLVRGVKDNKYALGYFGFAYYEENKGSLKLLGVDSGDGPIKPDGESVGNGTYKPLSRPLFIYVSHKSLEKKAVAEFVEFYLEVAPQIAPEVDYVAAPSEAIAENGSKLEAAMAE